MVAQIYLISFSGLLPLVGRPTGQSRYPCRYPWLCYRGHASFQQTCWAWNSAWDHNPAVYIW